MKITDAIITQLVKGKGIVCDTRNVEMEFTIPSQQVLDAVDEFTKEVKVKVKIDHIVLKVEKGES